MQKNINTVILGGTYNPVHIGHLNIAEEVEKTFSPERIILVPSYIPAHKRGEEITDSFHRLEMLKIACRGSNFQIDTCELDRKGVSYSIDTIRYIKQKYNLKSKPGFLIGDDLIPSFKKWKNAQMVADEAQIIVACRDHQVIEFDFKHLKIDNLKIDVSSSDIRTRLSKGKACRYLMPQGVYEYIIDNKLYGDR